MTSKLKKYSDRHILYVTNKKTQNGIKIINVDTPPLKIYLYMDLILVRITDIGFISLFIYLLIYLIN